MKLLKILIVGMLVLFNFNYLYAKNYKKFCLLDNKYLERQEYQTKTYEFNNIDDLLEESKKILKSLSFYDIQQKENILIAQNKQKRKVERTETETTYKGKWVQKNSPFITVVGNVAVTNTTPSYEIESETEYKKVDAEITIIYKANILIQEISENIFKVRAFFVCDYFENGNRTMEFINKTKKLSPYEKDCFNYNILLSKERKFSPYEYFFSKLENYVNNED